MATGMRIAVIFGGRSVEHDVSIVTAHQVMAVLAASHEVVPVYITREGAWLTGEGLNDLDVYKNRRWEKVGDRAFIPPVPGYGGLFVSGRRFRKAATIPVDVVVPAIHGTFGEDGTLQGLLELAEIAYVGSGVVGSAVGMDKVAMKSAFRAHDLPTVDDVLVHAHRLSADADAVIDEVETAIGYPAFVKPTRLGSSVGIARATDRETLAEALEVASAYDDRMLVERSMEGCLEINCSVLGGPGHEAVASVCEQPVAWENFLTFSDKYMRGGKGAKSAQGMASQERRIPAPISDALTKQVQDNAIKAFRAVDAAGVARVDSFVKEDSGESWVMEINTVPGSFSFYLWEASGVSFEELMDRLIAIAMTTHTERSKLMVTFESGMLEGFGGSKTDA